MSVRVRLDFWELLAAVEGGARRNVTALGQRQQPRNGAGNGWVPHIQGAIGEYVVAKHLGLHWTANPGRRNSADVGPYHVRFTPYPDGCLAVFPKDLSDAPYVLVRGGQSDPFVFEIAGGCWGADAKREYFWRSDWPHPTFCVPFESLTPLEDLEALYR